MKFAHVCWLGLLVSSSAWAADWPQFRGPRGLGSSPEQNLPVQWSSDEKIAWKTKLPGLGTSSPIVVGDRVYLTCYAGYAESIENPGSMNDLVRYVVAVDRQSGEIVWAREFAPALPESEYSGGNNSRHGYASSTIASDGQRLYVFFGKSGVYCLDLSGDEIWHADVGSGTRGWGSSNSPVLYKGLVIVNASVESQQLVALDKLNGQQVWSYDGVRGSWNTPLLVPSPNGDSELVISLPGSPEGRIVGIDPATGEELWYCAGIPDRGYVVPSVVAEKGIVYAIGGRRNTAVAVRIGGRGDVTDTHVLWTTNKGSNVASPVYHEGYLYWVHERQGTAICLDAQSGEVVYQKRLEPRPGLVYSSALVADDKIYIVSQYEGTYVLAAKPEFELLAHNVLEEDESRVNACPIAHDSQLLMRTDSHLYCIGRK